MRIVLMQPPLRNVIRTQVPDYVTSGHIPPMGLLYVQAAIEQTQHESIFLDADLEGWSHEESARKALSFEPQVIGLQAMTFTLPDAYLLAQAIKNQNADVKVIIGGPHPTIFPEETATLENVDFAFAGEGESGMPRFLDAFGDQEALARVPGLAFKRDGRIHYLPQDGYLEKMDQIPIPARRSSPYKRYSSVLAERSPNTVMITSRGCPYSCIFCNRMGRRYRFHSAQYVLAEIEDILSIGIGEAFIHDDTFTIRRERVETICRGVIERGYNLVWEARSRVDLVDEALIALMRRAGCHRLSFGVESGSPKVLKSMRKDIEISRVIDVFAACRRNGIIALADFMVGNLDETGEDIKMTLDLAQHIDADYVQFSVCSPYPATPLYELAMERAIVVGDVWREFAKNPLGKFHPPVWTEFFSENELTQIATAAYRSFYLRPQFILRQLCCIKSFAQFLAMVRGAVGMLKP
jgi:radical SAM superfamily enzyme YgiQ (UPF0313 family)